MSQRFRHLACSLLIAGAAATGPDVALAAEAGEYDSIDAAAMLLTMGRTIGSSERFSVKVRTGYDAVQPSGQKIEFTETRKLLVRRPDGLRIEAESSDGEKSLLVFDGKTISLSTAKNNVYAQASQAGTIDDAVVFFRKDLRMRLPLAAMLISTLREEIDRRLESADYVEKAKIDGKEYHHIAARGGEVDLQAWIPTTGPALPLRLVITYKHADGQPQFWANFSDWDLSPWVSDSKFDFDPPRDARKIAFLPQVAAVAHPVAAE